MPWHRIHHLLTWVIKVYGSMPVPPGRGDVLARHSPTGQHGFIVFGSSPSVTHSQGVRAAPNTVGHWELMSWPRGDFFFVSFVLFTLHFCAPCFLFFFSEKCTEFSLITGVQNAL